MKECERGGKKEEKKLERECGGEGGGERGPGGRAQHLQPPEREKTVRAKSILKTVMIS